MTKKKRIAISLNDYAYNQLIAVVHDTHLTKSDIINEVLERTLPCREKHKFCITITKSDSIIFDIVDK